MFFFYIRHWKQSGRNYREVSFIWKIKFREKKQKILDFGGMFVHIVNDNRDTLTEMYSFSPLGVCIVYLEWGHWIGKMSMCLIASVQTSLTMPVHLCKILYVSLCLGFEQRKNVFFSHFCNIKPLCISLLPVYFIKVLQNYGNFCNRIGTWKASWSSQGSFPNLQFIKKMIKIK